MTKDYSKPSFLRINNWWEPTYDPTITDLTFHEFQWDTNTSVGPKNAYCVSDTLEYLKKHPPRRRFKNVHFDTCDFVSHQTNFKALTFESCTFTNCHFSASTWEKIKFQNCSFTRCSFGTASFIRCQFFGCKYDRISFSGSATVFIDCILDAEKLVNAAYTNLDEHTIYDHDQTLNYQKYRLELTKTKIAHKLLKPLARYGDDDLFYRSFKTYMLQKLNTLIYQANHELDSKLLHYKPVAYLKMATYYVEREILRTSGSICKWGQSISRAMLAGITLIMAFSLIYNTTGTIDIYQSTVKAADISLLAGYTKYADASRTISEQTLMLTNLILGLWWYAIIVPTLINRVITYR